MNSKVLLLAFICLSFSAYSQKGEPILRIQSGDVGGLYKDIVNDFDVEVIDRENVCHATHTIHLSSADAEISKKETHYQVLPKKDICIIKVYVEEKNEIVEVGNLEFKAIKADTNDGIFRMAMPVVITKTDNKENFITEGKTIKPNTANRYMIRIANAPIIFLFENIQNSITVWLTHGCDKIPDVIVDSPDCEVVKDEKKAESFFVTPKAGAKKCTLNVYLSDKGKKKKLLETRVFNVKKK